MHRLAQARMGARAARAAVVVLAASIATANAQDHRPSAWPAEGSPGTPGYREILTHYPISGRSIAELRQAIVRNGPPGADPLKPTASRYAFLMIIDLLSSAVGYRLDPSARETLRRIKYTVLNHRKGKVLEPLGD